MIVVIDNYDSFTFNLVQYMLMAGADVRVYRNDETTVAEIAAMNPSGIVISPGPCTPDEAGISVAAVRALYTAIPIFGVCLGHQAIGQAFGATIVRADEIMHGKVSLIHQDGVSPLFRGLSSTFYATRYHSLVISPDHLPDCLRVTARTDSGLMMALEHREYPVFGVQFHPEAVLTEFGHEIIENFLAVAGEIQTSTGTMGTAAVVAGVRL
ncbi:MAG: anthranilate synthase component II [Bacilli bacterium]